jgi:hypothetical protein
MGEKYSKPDFQAIGFNVTTKCNLKCKGCIAMMDKYENPYTPDINTLLSDAESLLECVNFIEEFYIVGGESFLNRKLHLLFDYLFNGEYSDKIGSIRVLTNARIMPNKETLEILSKYNDKNEIHFSEYDDKNKQNIAKLRELGINCIGYAPEPWSDAGVTDFRGRSVVELKRMYSKCYSNKYHNCVVNGELHPCPRSAHSKDLELIPDYKSDYVNLREGSAESKVSQMHELQNKDYICSCNHCDFPFEIRVPGKEFNENKLSYEKEFAFPISQKTVT